MIRWFGIIFFHVEVLVSYASLFFHGSFVDIERLREQPLDELFLIVVILTHH